MKKYLPSIGFDRTCDFEIHIKFSKPFTILVRLPFVWFEWKFEKEEKKEGA